MTGDDRVIEGEIVELEVTIGTAIARVEVPTTALAKQLKIAFFNRAGKPVKARFTTVYTDWGPQSTAIVPKNAPVVAYDGPDSPVYGEPQAMKMIGMSQARKVRADSWRADFTPEDDEFVTDFVLGSEDGVEYAATLQEPIVLWRGHRMVVGVSKRKERDGSEAAIDRSRRWWRDSRGRIQRRDDSGSLHGGAEGAGSGEGRDRQANLDGGRVVDSRRYLPGSRRAEGDQGGD